MKAAGQSFCALMTWCRLVLVLGSLMGGFGCKPKVGEDCATSVDCSFSGDRLCDVTLPGGYCTVFNCEPNGCPDEAVCVAFSEGTCSTASVSTRFRRTFCMRSCEEDSDCRGGSYQCIDVSRDQSQRIVDRAPSSQRICAVPSSRPIPPPSDSPQPDPAVCFPSDASFDLSRPEAGPPLRDASAEADGAESSVVDRADSDGNEAGSETGADATIDAIEDTVDEPEATLNPP